jgi:hypothetical protein
MYSALIGYTFQTVMLLLILRVHVECLTQLCSTIQIQVPQKLGCLTQIKFDMKQQLSNKTLFKLNSWPKLCSNNVMFN